MNFKSLAVLTLLTVSCAKGPANVITQDNAEKPQGDPNRPTFQDVQTQVIQPKCLRCHGAGGAGGVSLETHADFKANVTLIRDVVASSRMPPARVNNPLSGEEKDLLLRHIDQGALEN